MRASVPLSSRRVFVDTSAYFSVANRREVSHVAASSLMEGLVAQRRLLFTSNFIVAELHALLLTRINRTVARAALAQFDASRATTVVRVSSRDERRAREIIEQYLDKDFSYTDATSFAIMERLHIHQAFTLDEHFTQYGLTVLPLSTSP